MSQSNPTNYYLYTLKVLFGYVNKYRPVYWVWMGVRIIYVAIETLLPVFLGHIISLLTQQGDSASWATVGNWATLYIAMLLTSPLLEVLSGNRTWVNAWKIGQIFRQDAVERIKYAGLEFWQDKNKGSVMKIIDTAYDSTVQIVGNINHSYIGWGGIVVGTFLASAFIDPYIFFIYTIDVILFTINLWIMMPREDKQGLKENKAQETVSGKIMEYLNNIKTVVYLNLFTRQEREVDYYQRQAYKEYYKHETITSIKWLVNNQLQYVIAITVFVYALIQVFQGRFDVGILTTVTFFSFKFYNNLGVIVWQTEQLIRQVNGMQRFFETFDGIKPKHEHLVPTAHIAFASLTFKGVSLQREERETLSDISFTILKGQKVAIVGYTGSGKSTLLDIMLKVITTYSGTVLINQRNYKDLKEVDIANIFSIVPQEVQLFRDTVNGNILASNDSFNGSLDDILKVTCLEDLIEKLPHGLDQHIHEGSINMSGGERQRIGIARALVQEQPILVLDEATASLDPRTEREVVSNIIDTYPDMTMIYVTHKYSLLNYFDHILVLSDGKVIEEGTFEKLKGQGGLFSDLYEASQNG